MLSAPSPDALREPPDLLVLEEVARTCRTTVATVRHWIHTGKLASIRPGRRRLVRRIELERFLESGQAG